MYNEGIKAFQGAVDITRKRVIQIAANGNISHNSATATNSVVGVSELSIKAGDNVPVKLLNFNGTAEIEASGVIAVGDAVYADASGKIQALPAAAGDYRYIGVALEAAGADGDIIEVLLSSAPIVTTVV